VTKVHRPGGALVPAQHGGEGVDHRRHLLLDVVWPVAFHREEIPAHLPVVGSAGEVDLQDPADQLALGEVGLDPLQRVLVRVQEQPAVP